MKTYATVDDWYTQGEGWRDEVAALRDIMLSAGLTETMKWNQPCYTDKGRNIAIIGRRKEHAVASLMKGALLGDPRARLLQAGQIRSARYMPFTSIEQVRADAGYLADLVAEAIEAERAGLRVEKLPDTIEYIEELQQRMDADPAFRTAFEALTPGRRRGYNLHFGKAKKAETRESRITQFTDRIFMGKGLLECHCGRSKRLPRCDGTHRTPE